MSIKITVEQLNLIDGFKNDWTGKVENNDPDELVRDTVDFLFKILSGDQLKQLAEERGFTVGKWVMVAHVTQEQAETFSNRVSEIHAQTHGDYSEACYLALVEYENSKEGVK